MNNNQPIEDRRPFASIIHPETGKNIVESGILDHVTYSDDLISVTLVFPKARDPFANSIRRQVKDALEAAYPQMIGKIVVYVKEAPPKHAPTPEPVPSTTGDIKTVLAIASAKGGVGKSTVTANLAVTLARMGYKVGVLDADIYGPSQPRMFGVEGYMPPVEQIDGHEVIVPAVAHGVKIMSIGFLINPTDALVWRGPMATRTLKQLIHQTAWGMLDFLLIDLPPGTGDIHLTVLQEIKVNGAVIVSTPQQVALADVLRGIHMFRSPMIDIPILGLIENMAWFTPAELPDNKYYIFGQGGAKALAKKEGIELLGQIPLIQSVMQAGDEGTPGVERSEATAEYYRDIASKIVNNLNNSVEK